MKTMNESTERLLNATAGYMITLLASKLYRAQDKMNFTEILELLETTNTKECFVDQLRETYEAGEASGKFLGIREARQVVGL